MCVRELSLREFYYYFLGTCSKPIHVTKMFGYFDSLSEETQPFLVLWSELIAMEKAGIISLTNDRGDERYILGYGIMELNVQRR